MSGDREAFEACPDLQDYCDFSRCPDGTRRGIVVYNDPWTQGAWQGWQAALAYERAKQAEPVALHIDHITPDDRKRYYDFEKYADHLPTCKQPRGDQSCECGYSAVRTNLSDLLDELAAPAQQEPPQQSAEPDQSAIIKEYTND